MWIQLTLNLSHIHITHYFFKQGLYHLFYCLRLKVLERPLLSDCSIGQHACLLPHVGGIIHLILLCGS